jgi:hypothetical protein
MAIRTDASGDYLLRTTNLPPIGTWTIMGWFKMSVNKGDFLSFFGFGNSSGGEYFAVFANSSRVMHSKSGNERFDDLGFVFVVGTWYHIAQVGDASGPTTLRTYLDSGLLFTSGLSLTPTAQALSIANNPETYNLDGCSAAVKVYAAVLTAEEIAQEMRYYRPARTANLNTWLPCVTSAVAANATDMSGNGFNMTVGGTLAVEDGPPIAWAPRHRMSKIAAPLVVTATSLLRPRAHPMQHLLIR